MWERIGGLPGAAATGVRGITGILAPGWLPGAAIGAGGEVLAQGIESLGGIGLDQSAGQRISRILTEGVAGAIPFSKVLKAGQLAKNFARAGGVAAAGDVARQMTEQGEFLGPGELDYRRLATATGIGGAAGATGQKVIDYLAPGSRAASKAAPVLTRKSEDVVEQTARPGGSVLVPKGQRNKQGTYGSYEREDVGPNWTVQRPGEGYGGQRTLDRTGTQTPKGPQVEVPSEGRTRPVAIRPAPGAINPKTGKPSPASALKKAQTLAEEFFAKLEAETGQAHPAAPQARPVETPNAVPTPAAPQGPEPMPWEDLSGWADQPPSVKGTPIRYEPGVTPREQKVLDREARDFRQAESDAIRNRKETERLEEARVAKERADEAKARGLVPEDSVIEKASRVNEEGAKETVTRRWAEPAEQALEDLDEADLSAVLGDSPAGKIYAEHRKHGLSREAAWARAQKYDKTPSAPGAEPSTEGSFSLADLLGRTGQQAAETVPEVAAEAATPIQALARIFRPAVEPQNLGQQAAETVERAVDAPSTALARFEGGGVPARNQAPAAPPPDFIDAEFTEEPLQRLLTGKVTKPKTPKKGTQIQDMGPNWPSQEDVTRQSSTFFDDEIDDLTRATDVAGDAYRQAKLGGDPEMARARGAELSELARRLGLPVGKPKGGAKAPAAAPEAPKPIEPSPAAPPAAMSDLEAEIETVAQELAAANPGTRAESRLKGVLHTLLKRAGLVSGERPVAEFGQTHGVGPGPAGSAGPVRPEPAFEPSLTGGDWVQAQNEYIERLKGGQAGRPGEAPPPTGLPPTPPPAPPPGPPVPRTPKGKGPAPKTGGEPAPVSGLQAEADRLLREMAGQQPGSPGAKKVGKSLSTLAPRIASAEQGPKAAAQASLDKLKQILGVTEKGSAAEKDVMAQVAQAQRKFNKLPDDPTPAGPTILSKGEGKPRLTKPAKKDGKGLLGEEKGLATDMLPLSVLTTLIGGLGGAALNPDDPFTSALVGAALGFAGPQIPFAMSRMNMPKIGESINEVVQGGLDKAGEFTTETIEKIPNAMRANLLWSGNLPINAGLAPYGSAAIGGLEQWLQGNPAGRATLEGLNPAQFARDMWANTDEATELIAKGEMGRLDSDQLLNPSRSVADMYMSGPAIAMASGDVTGRNAMKAGGMTEEMARKYAVTGEPKPEDGIGGFIGHTIANIGRGAADTAGAKIGKAAIGVAQPFRRTMANVIAQGMERLPGVGVGVQLADKGLKGIDWNEVRAQQAMSLPISALSALLGANVDPETAKLLRLRALLSNMSGVYSLPASLSYALGMGLNEGQSAKQLVKGGMSEMLPLPSTAAFEDAIKAGIDLYSGETPKVPRQMYPGLVRDVRDWTGASENVPSQPRRIPRMNRSRNRER